MWVSDQKFKETSKHIAGTSVLDYILLLSILLEIFSIISILLEMLLENSSHFLNPYIWSPFSLPSKAVTLSLNPLSYSGCKVPQAENWGVVELASCFLLSRITGRDCLLLMSEDRNFIHFGGGSNLKPIYLEQHLTPVNYFWDRNFHIAFLDFFF